MFNEQIAVTQITFIISLNFTVIHCPGTGNVKFSQPLYESHKFKHLIRSQCKKIGWCNVFIDVITVLKMPFILSGFLKNLYLHTEFLYLLSDLTLSTVGCQSVVLTWPEKVHDAMSQMNVMQSIVKEFIFLWQYKPGGFFIKKSHVFTAGIRNKHFDSAVSKGLTCLNAICKHVSDTFICWCQRSLQSPKEMAVWWVHIAGGWRDIYTLGGWSCWWLKDVLLLVLFTVILRSTSCWRIAPLLLAESKLTIIYGKWILP